MPFLRLLMLFCEGPKADLNACKVKNSLVFLKKCFNLSSFLNDS